MNHAMDETTPAATLPAVTPLVMTDPPPPVVPAGPETAAPPATAAGKAADEPSDSWWDLLRILVYALVIALIERTLFFQPYNIPSGSMEDTLLIGDFLFVEKFSYGYSRYSLPFGRFLPSFGRLMPHQPERGDVAVFALPSDPKVDFIKRIVGVPGDHVQMLHGVLYLNDHPIPKVRVSDFAEEDDHGGWRHIARYRETMPNGKSYYVLDRDVDGINDNTQVYMVPAGHYFMMGDNRDDSDDSRGIVGYLPAENLVGRAEFKFFSINERKTQFFTFWKWPSAIRWRRLLHTVD